MFSTWMYCQTSISVQFDSGKTRMLSPGRRRPFSRFHSSGRWCFGSHCPLASRSEKMRSLARERSSSRRAPPNAASKLPASSADSSDVVFSSPQQRCVPDEERLRAVGNRLLVGVDDQPGADFLDVPVPELDHLAELVGGVDVQQREGNRTRMKGLLCEAQQHRRVLADRVEHDRSFELRDDLPHDVKALRLERPKMVELRRRSRGRLVWMNGAKLAVMDMGLTLSNNWTLRQKQKARGAAPGFSIFRVCFLAGGRPF